MPQAKQVYSPCHMLYTIAFLVLHLRLPWKIHGGVVVAKHKPQQKKPTFTWESAI